MAYVVADWDGCSLGPVPPEEFEDLLHQLQRFGTEEHPDISVHHDSGWSLCIGLSLEVWIENLFEDETRPRHVLGLQMAEVVALMQSMADGDIAGLLAREWRPGYPWA